MAVPESIRNVPRPVNTIVQNTGRVGPKQYVVRERKEIKYVPGKNPQPVNGKTVGYIIGNSFVPVVEKTAASGPDVLSYGGSALVRSVSEDIMADLLAVYPPNDACSIMAIAAIKVLRPRISAKRMKAKYDDGFLSVYYPNAAVSMNSVSSLYKKLGADGKKREAFFMKRMNAVSAEHHIVIDGTLKQDTSKVNDLSAFSYKARLKGCEDISLLYAYDLENMEPVCAQVFPGNSVDAASYRSFIRDNHIQKGLIIDDKGFPPNMIRNELKENRELHYLTPMKRNDQRIAKYNLLDFEGVLPGIEGCVQYKKVAVSEDLFLYAYRDSARASQEEQAWLKKIKHSQDTSYDQQEYEEKRKKFGFILFESDQDMPSETAYLCYEDRWKLEIVFRTYKSDDCLDRTAVHGDFSVIGSEFVNFISTLMTCRIIEKAKAADILQEMTFGDMIEDVNTAWRKRDTSIDKLPKVDDDQWFHTIPKVAELLVRLGLAEGAPKPEPKKRGRKPGTKNKKTVNDAEVTTEKRPVGRPRKNPLPDPALPKKPVGRPRIRPEKDPTAERRPVGRPRVKPLPDPNQPKRPVGRPKKVQTNNTVE